jgi:hypothetical protein
VKQTNKAKSTGKGGRLKKMAAPDLRLRTLSERELLKVRGGGYPTKGPQQ